MEDGVCYDQCVLLAKLFAFDLLHFVLQGQTCLLCQVSLEFLLCITVPFDKKYIWGGGVLVLEGLVGHQKIAPLQLKSSKG